MKRLEHLCTGKFPAFKKCLSSSNGFIGHQICSKFLKAMGVRRGEKRAFAPLGNWDQESKFSRKPEVGSLIPIGLTLALIVYFPV